MSSCDRRKSSRFPNTARKETAARVGRDVPHDHNLKNVGDLGYVWRPEATPTWEPGIPSLMNYVRAYTPVTMNP